MTTSTPGDYMLKWDQILQKYGSSSCGGGCICTYGAEVAQGEHVYVGIPLVKYVCITPNADEQLPRLAIEIPMFASSSVVTEIPTAVYIPVLTDESGNTLSCKFCGSSHHLTSEHTHSTCTPSHKCRFCHGMNHSSDDHVCQNCGVRGRHTTSKCSAKENKRNLFC